ncbi:MAG: metal-dependent hydrolase [Pseudomonadota bacterium]|nr:metal-dependent hydrolase [Alphaproteobacteria bacterium]MDP5012240.1 metal-dependent hydrolase [Alphaproteobacteria bacterium]MDP5370287.1 metal-dependent hydrolase [Pseudomonadota bacterium]
MDLITRGLLGAVVAQVGFQRHLGKRAILWGGIVGLLPDADVLVAKCVSTPMAMELIHRGVTHSVFFAFIMAIPLGMALYHIDHWLTTKRDIRTYAEQIKTWSLLCFWVLITHPLLDLFTTFGTQLLSPFLNHRFALNAIPIIDPVYSVPLVISIVVGLAAPYKSFIVSSATLFLTSVYLLLGIAQHDKALGVARNFCAQNNLKCSRIEAFPLLPTIFAQRLWVQTNDAVYVSEYSTWTKKCKPWVAQTISVIPVPIREHIAFKTYDWFTNGIYVTKAQTAHGFCVIDGRYGLLSHQPFGRFCVCINGSTVVKNVDYDEVRFVQNGAVSPIVAAEHLTLGSKIRRYWGILKDLCVWTFAGS